MIRDLAELGYKAVDADSEGWSHWVDVEGNPTGANEGRDWIWREDRIQHLLATDAAEVLFLSGCAENMSKFFPEFDQIVLLSAPTDVLVERLATRTDNPYGKRPQEVAAVLANVDAIEPRLRRVANHEVDTRVPLRQVVLEVLKFLDVEI